MARRDPGATLPILRVRGDHAALGRAMGEFRAAQIRKVVVAAEASLWEADVSIAALRDQIAPYLEAAGIVYPHYLEELREMAAAAHVPFEVLFRLNCYESRPPGTPPGSMAGPVSAPQTPATPRVPVKDPSVLAARPDGEASRREPADAIATGGCTSIASRGNGTVILGHTEDSSPDAVEGIYLLDATLEQDGEEDERFLALNYAQTLPGCAAGINRYGLAVLIDALPDPDRRIGAPRHFVSRALLAAPSLDAAIGGLRTTARGGGWNYLIAQGDRYVDVETTATRTVIAESGAPVAYAHSNHYLSAELAADTNEPRENSRTRLTRARELMAPALTLEQMKAILSDRTGYPDSICRDRTIAAWVADVAAKKIEVCWGEPDGATWTPYAI